MTRSRPSIAVLLKCFDCAVSSTSNSALAAALSRSVARGLRHYWQVELAFTEATSRAKSAKLIWTSRPS